MNPITNFLSGSIALSCLLIALFFLRFWRATRDPFFVYFAASFAIEAASRAVSGLLQLGDENPAFYGLRVIAYGLILLAIWQKNRR
ncbi:MAG TPA: DUF5985 family protein [Ramlibacter sp.]